MNFMPGWQNLIVCDEVNTKCDFAALIKLINAAITDLTILATLLTVIVCIVVGFQLLTAGANAGVRAAARKRFTAVLIGYVCILGAWVVVYTITSNILDKNAYVNVLQSK